MNKIVIENGRLIDPANKLDQTGPLYIAEGKIVASGHSIDNFQADQTIDAENLIVCPGFVDMSVRLREPGHTRKGSIQSETQAAAKAGVTSLCLPPDTRPIIDTPAVVEYIKDKSENARYPNVFPIGALTRQLEGKELSSMYALRQAGCVTVSNASLPVANLQVLRRAMEYADTHRLLVMHHPQDHALSRNGCAHEGANASRYGLPGIPAAAETIAVAQCLELAELTGCRVHFSQISCKSSVMMIQQAKKKGLTVSADTTAHQLHLTEDNITPFDSAFHVSPPLRSKTDKMMLREGLANQTINAICSDHQPHDIDAKLGAFPETEPGMAALETLLPLTLQLVRENAVTLTQAIAALSCNPAKILGINKGTLTPGFDADICIFDPNQSWIINQDNWLSAGKNTPYWGQEMQGQAVYTLQNGKLIHT